MIERFPGDAIGYMSIGDGGLTTGVVKLTKSGPVVSKNNVKPKQVSPPAITEAAKALHKSLRSWGKSSLILGCSQKLEWSIKGNLDVQTQEDFAYKIRTDPQTIIGSPTEGLIYTGLLMEGQGTALIMGVGKNEFATHEELVRAGNCEPVRRVIPALAVLNLLLADDRVMKGEFLPLVIDQGHALVVIGGANGWQEIHARRFVGPNYSCELLSELGGRIQTVSGDKPKFLVANSMTNAGAPAEETLAQSGMELHPFHIGNLKPEEIFVYASALF